MIVLISVTNAPPHSHALFSSAVGACPREYFATIWFRGRRCECVRFLIQFLSFRFLKPVQTEIEKKKSMGNLSFSVSVSEAASQR